MMADVLIWIPCRNYERFLPEAFTSACNQTHPCVVVVEHDNCGGLSSSGVAVVRNRVLSWAAENDFAGHIVFLDADDRLPLDYVEKLVSISDGKTIIATDGQYFGDGNGRISVREPVTLKTLLDYNTIHCSALIPLEAFRRCGGFDPTLSAWEDWDLWCRLATLGVSFRVCRKTLLYIRRHPHSRHANKKMSLVEARSLMLERYDRQERKLLA